MQKLACLVLMGMPLMACAEGNDGQTGGGFSGSLGLGVGYYRVETNFFKTPSDDQRSISSLNPSPAAQHYVTGVPSANLRYALPGSGTQLFLSVEPLATLGEGGGLQAGVRQTLPGAGALYAALKYDQASVWRDPYALNTERSDDKLKTYGFAFGWHGIMDTPFSASLSYGKVKMNQEQSGQNLGLSAANQALLDRNGKQYGAQLAYTLKLDSAGQQSLSPALIYVRNDLDGKAMSTTRSGLQLAYAYKGDLNELSAALAVARTGYQAGNPIFAGRKADSDDYLLTATYTRKQLFGAKAWSAFVSGVYGQSNSDINFFDAQARALNVGIGYRF